MSEKVNSAGYGSEGVPLVLDTSELRSNHLKIRQPSEVGLSRRDQAENDEVVAEESVVEIDPRDDAVLLAAVEAYYGKIISQVNKIAA